MAAKNVLARSGAKPLIMGIVNVTPDSFSDGGLFAGADAALLRAKKMVEEGADLIDIGAESTRPGFTPISAEAEWARLEAPLAAILRENIAPVSVDTTKAEIARRAVALGAAIINDVSGLHGDPALAEVSAESGAALVVMHHCAEADPARDILEDMRAFFARALARAEQAGVRRENIILDPGVGFGKTFEQNLVAATSAGALKKIFGLPVLVGLSRKRFIGAITGAPVERRLAGTLAADLAALHAGADILRVHDVAEHADAIKVWSALVRA
ncbi:dihydropteroate synthase [Rhodoblastus acidophilus]|uniref:Dihydropteroate synthase n=1 Tax=Rhodoblastus acidophilus TaxID=1074 RepID=A0A6N8DPP7_RHOAC|nr:dihydropteroate synthase [Rhodoblastus acidophilus]MCW2275773.1 dihydropteroate synthase [Rhodoblastus acidophilus]MTV32377.1 dihydropteroate synthase [Rhodoblastus acidophilus]